MEEVSKKKYRKKGRASSKKLKEQEDTFDEILEEYHADGNT